MMLIILIYLRSVLDIHPPYFHINEQYGKRVLAISWQNGVSDLY